MSHILFIYLSVVSLITEFIQFKNDVTLVNPAGYGVSHPDDGPNEEIPISVFFSASGLVTTRGPPLSP